MRKFKQSGLNHISNPVLKTSNSVKDRELRDTMLANIMWKEATGSKISESSYVVKFQEGTLVVGCKSSVWANELTLMKKDILEKLKNTPSRLKVKDIFFTVKRIQKQETKTVYLDIKEVEKVDLTEEDIKFAEKLAENAKGNPELAEAIKRAYLLNLRASRLKLF